MNDVDPKDEQPASELDTAAAAEEQFDDEHTTEPNPVEPQAIEPPPPQTADGWQMPEPKFQQSSGYLPQGYIDQLGIGEPGLAAVAAPAVDEAPQEAEEVAPALEVEPQPDISELEIEPVVAAAPVAAKPRGSGSRVVMLLLGLIGMVLFLAAFLALVYFLFLAPADGGSQF